MDVINVQERGATDLRRDQYLALESSPEFWSLVDAGILSLERGKRRRFGLKAGPHVGQAIIGNFLIRISEKIPGALLGLLKFADEPDVRLQTPDSFADPDGEFLRPFVDRFLELLDGYLVAGRRKVYLPVTETGSIPRGKLLVSKTMRRWAVGRTDQVVFVRDELSPRTFINQLIGLAIQAAGGSLAFDTDEVRRRRLRTAAILFEDSGWHTIRHLPLRDLERRYHETQRDWGQYATLGAMTRLLALHFYGSIERSPEKAPASWFVNLETLFEDCVRQAVRAAADKPAASATDWRAERRYVVVGSRPYRAEPDIVLWQDYEPLAVLDAKFKDLDTTPQNADVYQLLAHAHAWQVTEAALLYPSDQFDAQSIGVSASGVTVRCLQMNCRDLYGSARSLWQTYATTEQTAVVAEA